MSLIDREHELFLPTYKRLPIVVERAEGMYVYAADGTRYLDFLGGIAVNSVGHSHPRVIEAIETQLRRYMHVSNYFYQDAQIAFAEKLSAMTGYHKVFLTNSGTEATEGAMKLARAFGSAEGRQRIFGFTGGFHGRTYGALSIMDKPRYKDGMGPFLPETGVLPFNDVQALRDAMSHDVCAIVVEFLQGEGGVRWATQEFADAIAELREQYGFLLIGDEIQAGAGRTGDFFGFERFGIVPDIVTMAKAVGGGLPLGAILVSERLSHVWGSGQHGTTFGGNAVACAAGSAVLDLLSEGLMDHARMMGAVLLSELIGLQAEFPALVTQVRGAGAMAGMELSIPAGPLVDALLDRGIIANATSDTVIRLVPPLTFQQEHVAEVIGALRAVLADAAGN
ncbi:MAG: acetylornithine/succinylornithine family transaminase [Bacteroidetes bacterium]|nr:acetylornithine/succinylornithine family transaminase [Bacteroidota bacterium]